MKRYGKVTKSLMAGILVGVTLVGCGSSGTNAPKDSQSEKADVAEGGSSGEKRTLEFWESSFNTELAYLKEAARIFEEQHPEAEFVISSKGRPEQQIDALNIAFSSDAGPDMFGYSVSSLIQPLIKGSNIVNLTEAFEENGWNEVIDANLLDAQRGLFDGSYYAFPVRRVVMGIFYNKPIFEKYNLEVPTTHDEFIKVCEILQKNGIVPIANPGKVPAATNRWFDGYLEKNAGSELHDKLCYGQTSLNCPEVIQSFYDLKDLSKYFQNGHFSAEENEARIMLYSGEAAMTYSANWEAGTLEQQGQNVENWGYFRFPSDQEKSRSNRFTYGIYINENSSNKDLAMDFLKICASLEPHKVAFEQEKGVDVIRNDVIDPVQLDSLRALLAEDAENPEGSYMATNEMCFPPKLTDTLYEALDKVLLEEITPEEGAQMLDATAEEIGFYVNK